MSDHIETVETWLKSGRYLPKPLRDFHDAKEVFKTAHTLKHDICKTVSWVDAQIYVIDVFLWFMARRGYTLQRSNKRLPFRDLQEDIEARRKSDTEAFAAMLQARPTEGMR